MHLYYLFSDFGIRLFEMAKQRRTERPVFASQTENHTKLTIEKAALYVSLLVLSLSTCLCTCWQRVEALSRAKQSHTT